ncbi:MAG: 1-(5-phosphoribosyl)-5-[(5-phosphoribosylamino)methylideneamino]imidazole-4-carboxamide isomerase [Candidatus Omnitrophica bacterium]|nr:1-(5-phosphoribosyl)-5-[(5-phosphoribosylamino)methylideneamino]imidazole-4-carboxamide isomerase [Candidatus Omnitrophota bacterium]MDD5429186.1 1-(5-phosphoribosyl)-5-[(5-phosphoribosylamino)methylideneamino]imidazole-4-carboxamide isomerase [Candidatus Omnitrophota bacterium]
MLVIPAIDLYQQKVVRLVRGRPQEPTVYSDDPVAVAEKWQAQGAKLLHVVDLSAAFGEGDNREIIKDICRKVNIDVQVGGGIRDVCVAEEILSLGAKRAIIGTKALDEDFLNELLKEFGKEKIAIGIDVLDSCLAVEGWKTKTDFNALDFVAYLELKGVRWIIYTDISRDGTLLGVNCENLATLDTFKKMNIILSGGIASIEDFKVIKQKCPFFWGVITGKALYEGRIDIPAFGVDF